jgi:hypothetical protein
MSGLTKRAAEIAIAELQLVRDAAQPPAHAHELQHASFRVWARELDIAMEFLRARVARVSVQKRLSAARLRERRRDERRTSRQGVLTFGTGTVH